MPTKDATDHPNYAQLLISLAMMAVVLLIASTMHPRRRARAWQQFSMRNLLIAMTAAAVLLWMIGGLLRLSN